MSPISIHAEALFNIKKITVSISLPSSCNEKTAVKLSSDGRVISVEHQGSTAILVLPCPVIAEKVPLHRSLGSQELLFRLSPALSEERSSSIDSASDKAEAPWSASELSRETAITCRSCGNQLVRPPITWKDLPSGNWADMMDLWHCHKPHPEGPLGTHNTESTKGYAANNQLTPKSGIGLVDTIHLHLLRNDCIGIQVRVKNFLYQGLDLDTRFNHIISFRRALRRRPAANFNWPVAWSLIQKP